MLASLLNFDTKSLIGVLVWGNIATGIIVYLYQTFNVHKTDYGSIRNMTFIRFLSAVGYFLMFLRGDISDILSVNIGNTLLFSCQYMEARLMLELVNATGKRINFVLSLILASALITFNSLEFIFQDPSLRVGMASIIIFAIFFPPTLILMTKKEASKFKRGVSIFFVLLLSALIPRGVEAFRNGNISIHSNSFAQTLMFISFILLMMLNTVVYLLFMKEQTDIVIEKMATTDCLTNLMNRHSFLDRGKQAFESHKAFGLCISLLFFDLDHFKKVNDQYGHQFGDEVLTRFADLIKKSVRPSDLCCRYGGEEFIVLLTNVSKTVSESIAGRIMQELENITFTTHPDFRITASTGNICDVPKSEESLEDYICRGDKAMYEAKKEGRNKLVTCQNKKDF